jgi:hypothetical protein
MMKKQSVLALILFLLIPVVMMAGGFLSNLINPEIAAGHANYARNFRLLMLAKGAIFLASVGTAGILWPLVCFLVIRSKGRSPWWLSLAALGPFGFAVLAMLDDRAPAETDRHARFVRSLHWFVRAAYEACTFVVIWLLAYQAMVLLRNLIVMFQAARTGLSTAQIIDLQNASSGMWAFGEAIEALYLVILFYLLRPIVFNTVGRLASAATTPSRTAR